MSKQFRTLITLFLLLCSVAGFAQQAGDSFINGYLTYRILDSEHVEVAKCDKKASGDVILQTTVSYEGKSYQISAIADFSFFNCEDVARVFLPVELRTIGYRAFYGCRNLSSITLPNKLTTIGVEAFNYCTGLSKIVIPATVTEIGDGAFGHNWALKKILVDLNNSDYVDVNGILFSKNCTRLIAYPAGKTDQTYTLPANTTTIGTGAFASCKDLVSIVLPKDLIEIRRYAFQECAHLVSISIPEKIDVIESGAFDGCSSLRQTTLPKKMKLIGNKAFQNCTSLSSIVIPDGVESLGNRVFAGCTGLKNVAIPKTLTEIGDEAFAECEDLSSIHLFGTKPPKIGANVFSPKIFEKGTLYVKYFAVETYQHAEDWTNFQFVYKERATYRPYGTNY